MPIFETTPGILIMPMPGSLKVWELDIEHYDFTVTHYVDRGIAHDRWFPDLYTFSVSGYYRGPHEFDGVNFHPDVHLREPLALNELRPEIEGNR